jgi:hypothetical protein
VSAQLVADGGASGDGVVYGGGGRVEHHESARRPYFPTE